MKRSELDIFIGKRIKLFLDENLIYTGYILKIGEDGLTFEDKFGEQVYIAYRKIQTIKGAAE